MKLPGPSVWSDKRRELQVEFWNLRCSAGRMLNRGGKVEENKTKQNTTLTHLGGQHKHPFFEKGK